jgi:Family of unknown function (DUF6186)
MIVSRLMTIAAFAAAFALVGLVEVLGRRENTRVPTLGALCGFVMAYRVGRLPVGRVAVFGFWWWVGWHFFAR